VVEDDNNPKSILYYLDDDPVVSLSGSLTMKTFVNNNMHILLHCFTLFAIFERAESFVARPWTPSQRRNDSGGLARKPPSSSSSTSSSLGHVIINIDDPMFMPDSTPLLVVAVALGLLVAAQTFINQMLEGDRGLAAFLRDGSGYNKSGFQSGKKKSQSSSDPLPWLKLPQLDFVDVAGQEKLPKMKQIVILEDENQEASAAVLEELEQLRLKMNRELQEENTEEARRIRDQLEKLMKEKGIQYTASGGDEDAFQ
jgi:hypothetical protein